MIRSDKSSASEQPDWRYVMPKYTETQYDAKTCSTDDDCTGLDIQDNMVFTAKGACL
jgi:hypothetical protein